MSGVVYHMWDYISLSALAIVSPREMGLGGRPRSLEERGGHAGQILTQIRQDAKNTLPMVPD